MSAETPLEQSAAVCRGCMAESGEMKNMYEWGLSDDYFQVTAVIETVREPGLSELLCTKCEQTMICFKEFREQCQESDRHLKISLKTPIKTKHPKNEIECELQDKKLVIKIQAPLTEEKIFLPCPFHCEDKFTKKSDLFLHLKRVHNVSSNFEVELQYYCAEGGCIYNLSSKMDKWFSGRKFLNQHRTKVHMEKGIICKDCKTSFVLNSDYLRHKKTCNYVFICQICNVKYSTNEALMVHLKRKHPDVHKMYKKERKAEKKRQINQNLDIEKHDSIKILQTLTAPDTPENSEPSTAIILEAFPLRQADSPQEIELQQLDSPKKSLATQIPENITNDVTLLQWPKNYDETRTDDNSTQTVFEDSMSVHNDDAMYFPEIISLSDIQTQTLEFGLSRSNKETQIKNSETQSPDLSIKETQTCFCHYDTPKPNFRLFDLSSNLTSTETQTADRFSVKSDVLLSFNSAETQTCFDDSSNDSM